MKSVEKNVGTSASPDVAARFTRTLRFKRVLFVCIAAVLFLALCFVDLDGDRPYAKFDMPTLFDLYVAAFTPSTYTAMVGEDPENAASDITSSWMLVVVMTLAHLLVAGLLAFVLQAVATALGVGARSQDAGEPGGP